MLFADSSKDRVAVHRLIWTKFHVEEFCAIVSLSGKLNMNAIESYSPATLSSVSRNFVSFCIFVSLVILKDL